MAKAKNPDLHGAVEHRCRVAFVLIDVINAMDFPEAKHLVKHATPAATKIAKLKARARAANVPTIYANDNYGRWRSDFRLTIERARSLEAPGRAISTLLEPDDQDYFVLKPKHSAFYGSSLELLLSYLGTECLVLAGFAGDICVRFTAQDAFLRDYEIVIPSDGIASEQPRSNTAALEFMRKQLGAKVLPASRIDFRALRRARSPRRGSIG